MNKTIWVLVIAGAFLTGMIVSATPVYAPPEQAGGDTLVAAAIDALTTAVGGTSSGDTLVADAITAIPSIAGPIGATGDTGATGATGATGPTQSLVVVERVSSSDIIVPPQTGNTGRASCLTGEIATGGGFDFISGVLASPRVAESEGETPTSWKVFMLNEQPIGGTDLVFRATVMCAKLT